MLLPSTEAPVGQTMVNDAIVKSWRESPQCEAVHASAIPSTSARALTHVGIAACFDAVALHSAQMPGTFDFSRYEVQNYER